MKRSLLVAVTLVGLSLSSTPRALAAERPVVTGGWRSAPGVEWTSESVTVLPGWVTAEVPVTMTVRQAQQPPMRPNGIWMIGRAGTNYLLTDARPVDPLCAMTAAKACSFTALVTTFSDPPPGAEDFDLLLRDARENWCSPYSFDCYEGHFYETRHRVTIVAATAPTGAADGSLTLSLVATGLPTITYWERAGTQLRVGQSILARRLLPRGGKPVILSARCDVARRAGSWRITARRSGACAVLDANYDRVATVLVR